MLLTPIALAALAAPLQNADDPDAAPRPDFSGIWRQAPADGRDYPADRDHWTVEDLPLPAGCVMEVGGMGFLSDGRLAIATRRGQVWIVENPLADDLSEVKVTLFHEGLWEGLGLSIVDDRIHVLQRGELSRLEDNDGDGVCDAVVTVADDWGVSGHYHEFAFGLPRTKDGDWFMGLNVSFGDPEWWHGRSTVPYRGWVMRVSPDGTVVPWATGVRSPNGVAVDSKDRLFVTDNQGDWVASSPIYHVEQGDFFGHPKSLNWTDDYRASGMVADDEIPPAMAATGRKPVAVWIPYQWSRSTGNLLEIAPGGAFGVPEGQFVVAELTNGMILRAGFEEVQGVTQGWVLPLVQKIGSVNRVLQAPDGSIFCGLTNRGWGGLAPADGLVRVRHDGEALMEYADMRIVDASDELAYGFELTFSEPVAAGWEATPETVSMIQYDYDYWWEYGSPERHTSSMELSTIALSEDRRTLTVRSEDMIPAMCVRLTAKGVTSAAGGALVHPTISYTINQLPSGPKTNAYVSKVVPPPPSRKDTDAGVLRLSWGDALGQFDAPGWELCDAALGESATQFKTSIGNGALVGTGEGATEFATRGVFGDAYARVDFMLPSSGSGELRFGDVATIALSNDPKVCGTVNGVAPGAPAATGAGQWQTLEVYYRIAKGDAPASVDRVTLNGLTIQEDLEVPESSGARVPMMLHAGEGQVALRDIRIKPLDRPEDGRDWSFLDVANTWDEWELVGDANFELAGDELVGRGALGHLWAPMDDLGDFTMRARVQVNSNGAGAVVLRARETADGVDGYVVRINTSFPDGSLTGSISRGEKVAAIRTELVATDTWADLEVDVRNGEAGATVVVSLNGVEVNRVTDPDPLPAGGLALRNDHEGTVVRFQNLRIAR